MATFFTSDTHFGDHRTLNIHKRAFTSVAEMDDRMVEAWNTVVSPDDEVWHLGDFARRLADVDQLLAQLNGSIHLIQGNNDPAGIADHPFASVQHYRELDHEGRLVALCHYPFRSWNGQHRGSINLHGHSHGKLKPVPRQFDVGVDVWSFAPVSLEQILAHSGPLK